MSNGDSAKDQNGSMKQQSAQIDALQNQLGSALGGIEQSLSVTCDGIMSKMKQIEDKIVDMEKRFTELAKDAQDALIAAEAVEKVDGTPKTGSTGDDKEPPK